MAKYDKVPRKKKKAVKKAAGLQGKKTPKTEVVKLANKEAQKKKRDAATLRRYNANKEYLKSLNIPTDIITKSTSIKETKIRAEKYLSEQAKKQQSFDRQYKQSNLYARKINKLLDAGFTMEEATEHVGSFWRPATDKKIDEIIAERHADTRVGANIKFSSHEWLYVGYADTTNNFMIEDLSDVSDTELKRLIKYLKRNARKHPDDSSGFKGVFIVKHGTEQEMRYQAMYWYSRGYDLRPNVLKLSEYSFNKITVSNTFSQRDFWEMIYQCITQMKNEDVNHFFDALNEYCDEAGFPFMRNLNK